MEYPLMKKTIWILLLVLALPCFAITAGEIQELHNELLVLMDKYTWDSYVNPYTGDTVTVSTAERNAIKALCIAKYNEHKAAILLYAQELGIIQ